MMKLWSAGGREFDPRPGHYVMLTAVCLLNRDVFKITLANYQSWFETSVIFWLQTFKDECRRRMEKALEIEKDVRITYHDSPFYVLR